ncbi:MAG: TetR family transcriptional regulator [Pseudonocardiales bacterium]|nr:MAG: TetR family transcriptional regulator [Pseudonocardiales bacterium]
MSTSYEATGRTSQKARTRNALLTAPRELLAHGVTPTVEQAAAASSIARATAYRYFPNQRALLTATFPELTEPSLLGEAPPEDVGARLRVVVDAIARRSVQHERALRSMLRLSLEPDADARGDLTFRKGRRIAWVSEALARLHGRLPAPELDRLVLAIAAAVGIDALVWLTDIAGLSRDEAVDLMRWSASSLLRAALSEPEGSWD